MRRRKNLIPLTIDNLAAELPRGRAYTVEHLSMIFAGSPAAIEEVVETAVAGGRLYASQEVRGFRRTYWVPNEPAHDVATRRTQYAEGKGELRGYAEGLRSFMALCMAARRG